jgi:alkanesulfonate monooxygenase SsuD/methylene tetrahydromethanopterin reductase-like flavin-dependent oxidoreductase (luciferase family)
MKIGIGLPAYIPNVEGSIILDWARQADNGPFSSLGVLDRLTYGNYEPLVVLAAAAGATKRIRLMTTVLLAPLRNTAMLAKQSASLDALCGGRLTLGLGVGAREKDFHAASAPFHNRGKRYNEQLALLTRIWSGEAVSDQVGPIGPTPTQPGGPEVLIGGYSPAAVQHVRRWGNGFISGGGSNPQQASAFYRMAEEAWKEGGRPGKPRLVACAYYGLGTNATECIGSFIHDYYAFRGSAVTQQMVKGIPTTPGAIGSRIKAFEVIGADELILWACIPELDQIQRLADAIT